MTQDRRQAALSYRIDAAKMAFDRDHAPHKANGDEQRFAGENYAMSFTKGLAHSEKTGLLKEAADFVAFRTAIDSGFIDAFTSKVPVPTDVIGKTDEDKPIYAQRRQWEAPTAGLVFELEGPDPQAVTMPPAPELGSLELAYEMAEVYELALLRDVPFTHFQTEPLTACKMPLEACDTEKVYEPALPDSKKGAMQASVTTSIDRLAKLGFDPNGHGASRPRLTNEAAEITEQEAFRGIAPGEEFGPYLSQFMLIGSPAGNRPGGVSKVDEGRIAYGSITIDQKVATAAACEDFMISQETWRAVQDGYDPRDETPGPDIDVRYVQPRFMSTPRDLATYVHFDALYEAYLNAALILLGMNAPFDPSFAHLSGRGGFVSGGTRGEKRPALNAGGFALYGGPHILNLVTEVSTRALKAVRYQKFNNHIRLRPESLAGRLAHLPEISEEASLGKLTHLLAEMEALLSENGSEGYAGTIPAVVAHNTAQGGDKRAFLPMAFSEGSPMHPAYGAGHATVAGACVTILKAFFDTDAVLVRPGGDTKAEPTFKRFDDSDVPVAFVSNYLIDGGTGDELLCITPDKPLTLEGELNKLAANISVGRNMAGVHYFSDYYDSIRMGEEIAIAMLEEQALGYVTDPFVMSVPTFTGEVRRIGAR